MIYNFEKEKTMRTKVTTIRASKKILGMSFKRTCTYFHSNMGLQEATLRSELEFKIQHPKIARWNYSTSTV